MDEPEQPLQPIKKIDDEVLDRFINTYGFKREVRDTKKGEEQLNIASASIGDNIYIIRKKNSNYSFLSISKDNFDNFKAREKEGFTFKFIDFNTKYFKKMFIYNYNRNHLILKKFNIKKHSFDELVKIINKNQKKAIIYLEKIDKHNLNFALNVIEYLETSI